MRIPIVVTVFISAVAVALAWHDYGRLASARENHTKVVALAASRGISLDSGQIRISRHQRENRSAEVKLLAAEYIAFIEEVQARGSTEAPPDEATQKRMEEIYGRVKSLEPPLLKKFIEQILSATGLSEEMRLNLAGCFSSLLAQEHPKSYLTYLADSSGLLGNSPETEYQVGASLTRLAQDDLAGAIEWIRVNGDKFPNLVTDNAKQGVIVAAARKDPKIAFDLIRRFSFKNPDNAVENIALAAKTSGQRTTTLAALREYLTSINNPETRRDTTARAIVHLAGAAAEEGFETGSKWLAEAGFSPDEIKHAADGVHWNWVKHDEVGQWIEWLGNAIPNGQGDESIRYLVQSWTTEDPNAAGTWLAKASDSPAKSIAVRKFAETVAPFEPKTAVEWAMTLPPGETRDSTLKSIYHAWPKNDADGAAAFAQEHGIK